MTKPELALSPVQRWTNSVNIYEELKTQCIQIINKESERKTNLDPSKHIDEIRPYLLTIPAIIQIIEKAQETSPQLHEFEEEFSALALKDNENNKEEIASVLQEVTKQKTEIALNFIQLKVIIAEYLIIYSDLPQKSRQKINSEIKLNLRDARLSAYKHSIEGWELLQHYRTIISEELSRPLTQRFTEQHLSLLKFFKVRYVNSEAICTDPEQLAALNKARRTADLALCEANYEKVINMSKQENIIFHLRWEQTLVLWQHFHGIASNPALVPSRLDALKTTLGTLLNNIGGVSDYLINTPIKKIKDYYTPALIADLNAMLHFLEGFYSMHQVFSLNFEQRTQLLNIIDTIIETSDQLITGTHNQFKRLVFIHLDLSVFNRFTLNKDIEQAALIKQQQIEIEAYRQKVNEDYEQRFTALLASFPTKKKKPPKPEVIDDEADEDQDEDLEMDKGIEDEAWLKKHTVIFADSPSQNKPQHFLNLSSLARSLDEEQRKGNTIEVIRLHFAIADFYRLKALKTLNRNAFDLSSAQADLNMAYSGLNRALHESNQLDALQDPDKQAELTSIQSWAQQIINEIDKLLADSSKKLGNKLRLLQQKRAEAQSYIINKYGENAWFRTDQFDWNKLSTKAQERLCLAEEMKTLHAMRTEFNEIKMRFNSQKTEPDVAAAPETKPKPNRSKFFKEQSVADEPAKSHEFTLGDFIV